MSGRARDAFSLLVHETQGTREAGGGRLRGNCATAKQGLKHVHGDKRGLGGRTTDGGEISDVLYVRGLSTRRTEGAIFHSGDSKMGFGARKALSVSPGVVVVRTRDTIVPLFVGHQGVRTRAALQEEVGRGAGGHVTEAGVVLVMFGIKLPREHVRTRS